MDDPNMQNVPRHTTATTLIRDAIIAREGHSLVMCDFDQIEMRIFAHLANVAANDPGMVNAFLQPGDFFVNMAREITGDAMLTKNDPRRQMTKNAGYSKIYGAGVEKFALTARVAIEQARPFLERFDALYPGAKRVQDIIGRTAEHRQRTEGDAYVRSPLTNRKHVADPRRMYALVNYLVQGTAAEVLKMKGVELDNAGLGDYLVLPVHDEYVADVPQTVVRDAYGTLMEIMNDDSLFTVPITASVSTGKRWGSKEDYVIDDLAA
jgi:DNA polymerase-1